MTDVTPLELLGAGAGASVLVMFAYWIAGFPARIREEDEDRLSHALDDDGIRLPNLDSEIATVIVCAREYTRQPAATRFHYLERSIVMLDKKPAHEQVEGLVNSGLHEEIGQVVQAARC